MKKLIVILLMNFLVLMVSGQGRRLIVKQDGLRLSYDLEMVNVVQGACTKDLKFTSGDKYKITVYLANESGKKLTYTGGYVPIVSFMAPENGCFPVVEHINVNIPLNPGDIKQSSGYFTIHSGSPEGSIKVSEYTLRGYKIPGDVVKAKYYWAEGLHTSFNNYAMSEIFSLSCEKEPNVEFLKTQFMNHYEYVHNSTGDKLNKVTIMGPFDDFDLAKNIRSSGVDNWTNMCRQKRWKFDIERDFKAVCK